MPYKDDDGMGGTSVSGKLGFILPIILGIALAPVWIPLWVLWKLAEGLGAMGDGGNFKL